MSENAKLVCPNCGKWMVAGAMSWKCWGCGETVEDVSLQAASRGEWDCLNPKTWREIAERLARQCSYANTAHAADMLLAAIREACGPYVAALRKEREMYAESSEQGRALDRILAFAEQEKCPGKGE